MDYLDIGIGFFIGSLWTAILLFRARNGKTSIPPLPAQFDKRLEVIEDILGAVVQLLEERRGKK